MQRAKSGRLLCGLLISLVSLAGLSPFVAGQAYVEEPSQRRPVLYDVDVVVIGGGLSGVGAAVGAARAGAKTLIVERTGYLGGWIRGTGLGNVVGIEGWRPSLNEGVLLDTAKKMVELKAEAYPDLDTVLKRGNLIVTNYELLPQAFQSIVVDSGAQILYFATYSDSLVRNGKIEAVFVETPTGRYAVRGKVFIDCTGLATLAANSEAKTRTEEGTMGLAAWITNVDVPRFEKFVQSRPKEGSPELRKWLEGKLGFPITKFTTSGPSPMNFPWDDWWERNSGLYGDFFREAVDKGELTLFYTAGKKGIISYVEGLKVIQFEKAGGVARPRTYIVGVDPTNPKEVTEAHIKSSRLLFEYMAFLNKYIPGFEKAEMSRVADTTLNRAGRYIESDFSPTSKDIGADFKAADAICVLQRGQKGGIYQVPYRALLSDDISNLLAVGKSSAGGMRFRTHMLTMIMGQAAGTAAAISVREGVKPKDVSISKLQAELRKAGIKLE